MTKEEIANDRARLIAIKEELLALHIAEEKDYKKASALSHESDVVAQRLQCEINERQDTESNSRIVFDESAIAFHREGIKHQERIAGELANVAQHRANMERIWSEGFAAIADAIRAGK